MIIARDLYIEAGARLLIAAASFSVHPGDKIGLVGKNGAGKTTLLRTLAGELEPAAGTIRRSGVIGYLSQEAALAQLADDEVNALERVLTARDIGNLERRIERVRRQMELTTGTERDRLIARFSRLDDEFTALPEARSSRALESLACAAARSASAVESWLFSCVSCCCGTVEPSVRKRPDWVRKASTAASDF